MPDKADDIQRLVERMAPTAIYVQWSDDGQHIRKWSHEPFDGSAAFVDADELNALRAEVEMLRDLLDIAVDDHDSSMGRSNVPAHWSNRARAALTQTKDTTDDA